MRPAPRAVPGLRFAVSSATLIVVTALAIVWNERNVEFSAERKQRLDHEMTALALRITARAQAHRQVLYAARAFFRSSELVTRDEWARFIVSLELNRELKGIQGVGFAARITQADRRAHEAAVTAEARRPYTVQPDGERPLYAPIVYLEPFNARNQRAFGFDMYSETVRRAALVRSWQTGEAALSGRVVLVQEDEGATLPGVLLYLPVTAADAAQEGWVYSPFRIYDLLCYPTAEIAPDLHLQIFDEDDPPNDPLFDIDRCKGRLPSLTLDETPRATMDLPIDGRTWRLELRAEPTFAADTAHRQRELIATVVFGALFIVAVGLFVDARAQARALGQRTAALHRSEDQLRRLAATDPLTGIANRRAFQEAVDAAIQSEGPFALLYLDLDHFKEVNDRYGHAVGDAVLVEATARMAAALRPGDLLGRRGGDEFVALLPAVAEAPQAVAVGERLRRAIGAPWHEVHEGVRVKASVGAVLCPAHAADLDGLLRCADAAMYAAKAQGRDQTILYDPQPNRP